MRIASTIAGIVAGLATLWGLAGSTSWAAKFTGDDPWDVLVGGFIVGCLVVVGVRLAFGVPWLSPLL